MVPPEELEAKTGELLAKLMGLSPLVLKLTRKACLEGAAQEQERALTAIEGIYLDEVRVSTARIGCH